ncbi:MAG: hypothetical protein LBT79_02420 [Elusimicrobiota bacterium]|nr:hypothetical protein [Elusimicrobiota bacterium]
MKKLSVICILVSVALIAFIGTSCGTSNKEQKIIEMVQNYPAVLTQYGNTLQEQIIGFDNFMKNSIEEALASGKMEARVAEFMLKAIKNMTYEWTASSKDGNLWTVVLKINRPEAIDMRTGEQGRIDEHIYEVNLSRKTLCAPTEDGAVYLIGLEKYGKLSGRKQKIDWRKETLSSIK